MLADLSYVVVTRPIVGTLLAMSVLSLAYGLWGPYTRS